MCYTSGMHTQLEECHDLRDRTDGCDSSAALACYEACVQADAGDLRARFGLAVCLRELGRPAEALQHIDHLLGQMGDVPGLLAERGACLTDMDRPDEAAAAYDAGLAEAPDDMDLLLGAAMTAYRQGRMADALTHFQHMARIDATLPHVWLNMAIIFLEGGVVQNAEVCAREALALRDEVNERFYLGLVLHRTGTADEAATHLRAALAHDPDDRLGARQILAEMGLGETPESLSPDYVRDLFDDAAERFDDHLGALGYDLPERMASRVVQHLPETDEPVRVLDMGCGTGLLGAALRSQVDDPLHITGMDLSPNMLSRAERTEAYDDLREAALPDDLQQVVEQGERFAVVCGAEVVNYFGELEPLLRACADVLEPDGKLLFSIERAGAEQQEPYASGASRRYTHRPSYVRRAAKEAGLAVLDEEPLTLRHENDEPVEGLVVVLALESAKNS